MREELANECVACSLSFGEEQGSGAETIDAVDDVGSLTLRFQFVRKYRQGGWPVRAWGGNGQKAGRFTDGHDRVVFVEKGYLP
jgi:hypothetical protein